MAIGGCTREELRARMGHSEFLDWQAFYKVEPFGEIRQEQRNALVASTIANAHRDRKKQHEPFPTVRFMYPYEAADGQSHERKIPLREKFKMIAAYHNAKLQAGKN